MSRTVGEMNQQRKMHSYYDYSLLFLILFLVCFGLVMIYSTSSYNAQRLYNDPTHFLQRQALFAGAGILVMLLVSKIDYHIYVTNLPIIRLKPITILYIICLGLQTYVLVFGNVTKGSKRWIELGSLGQFQPSELTKIAVILFTAYIVNLAPKKLDKFTGFIRVCFFIAPLLGLIVIENLSTAIIVCVIMVSICFVASRKKGYFVISGALLAGLGVVFIFFFNSYRSERIDAWLHVETADKGYQILQGLYAIASGGVFGKGLGESMQKLGFIPESHNDMIFSVICEELGLFGAFALILLFILLIWRIFIIAINSTDLYGGLIATGVLAHIAIQVLINIAVVTNTIPSTGNTLPFISYGGSSVMVILFEMGIVLSVSNQIKGEK